MFEVGDIVRTIGYNEEYDRIVTKVDSTGVYLKWEDGITCLFNPYNVQGLVISPEYEKKKEWNKQLKDILNEV